jgi:hypothetical protein
MFITRKRICSALLDTFLGDDCGMDDVYSEIRDIFAEMLAEPERDICECPPMVCVAFLTHLVSFKFHRARGSKRTYGAVNLATVRHTYLLGEQVHGIPLVALLLRPAMLPNFIPRRPTLRWSIIYIYICIIYELQLAL